MNKTEMEMKKTILTITAVVATFLFSGCASSISSHYVSTASFSNLSCKQLKTELIRVQRKLDVETTQHDDKIKTSGAILAGTLLFPPAILALPFTVYNSYGSGHQIAELKGSYDAIRYMATDKRCAFLKEKK